MWLYKTGASENPVILYDYQKTRSGSCPREFLKGFSGILQTDGYQGYNHVENIESSTAWLIYEENILILFRS